MYKQNQKIQSNEQRLKQIHRNYVAADYDQNNMNRYNIQDSHTVQQIIARHQQEKNKQKQPLTRRMKMVDPFSDKHKRDINSFAYVYEAGGIPCKIDYKAYGNMKISWIPDVNIQTVPYDPLLVTCFYGIIEDVQPYLAIATAAIQFMLSNESAENTIISLLPKLVLPLRNALGSKNDRVFGSALSVLISLSNIVQSNLDKYLKFFIVPIWQRLNHSAFAEEIKITFDTLQNNGGTEVYKIIKQKIPTYQDY